MILITGWSQKLDGISFLADTNDHAEALKQMRDSWNARFSDQTKIVVTGDNDYLLYEEVDVESVKDFEDECPRREGWHLIAQEIRFGEINQRQPW